MIRKVIHYCWFGKGEHSELITRCISSWKKFCPDYEIIEWNETNFDINSTIWTKEAYEKKKYAFVSDYVRLYALYNYGGVYLDTDVELFKNIDVFLGHKAFSGFENDKYVNTGIMGSVTKHPVIKTFLQYYDNRHFINENGGINDDPNVRFITRILKSYGLLNNDSLQNVNGMHIYPKTYFCPIDANGNRDFSNLTHCVHHFNSSWRPEEERLQVALMHKWYYPIYKKAVLGAIYLVKLIIGNENARMLRLKYIKLFLRE
ncbi:glycosyl transferase [Bacillus sp. ISL-41]|uniref:glycosyltransferase family 32 protein n=1 Tax=Bacillus sp. ISL-41 TaxID=2819127 RepID=UPI001BEB7132|nr:glycosyltransferase [Bacillus sp. ISL-41]MBT2642202.1 glycosyl transferase [Bacillus sp. ISL-41]